MRIFIPHCRLVFATVGWRFRVCELPELPRCDQLFRRCPLLYGTDRVIINADTWNSLPQEYQQIMTQVFQEEALVVATAREQLDDQAMEDMAAMA